MLIKKAEPKTPHFLGLTQDIVTCSQKEKWGLKYGILSQPEKRKELFAPSDCSAWFGAFHPSTGQNYSLIHRFASARSRL
jgi:hypothetical protein